MYNAIVRNGLPIADLYNQYVADLKSMFDGFEMEEVEGESFTLYVTDSKNVKIVVTSNNAYYIYVKECCNNYERTITYANGSYTHASYAMFKSENGFAMSQTVAANSSYNAVFSWQHLAWFIGSGVDLSNGSSCRGIVTTANDYNGDDRDTLYMATDLHNTVEELNSSYSLFQGASGSMMVMIPMNSYIVPFRFDGIYLKLQSQGQYGRLIAGDKKIISGTDLCLEYTDD